MNSYIVSRISELCVVNLRLSLAITYDLRLASKRLLLVILNILNYTLLHPDLFRASLDTASFHDNLRNKTCLVSIQIAPFLILKMAGKMVWSGFHVDVYQ